MASGKGKKIRSVLLDLLFFTLGSLIYAVSVNMFTAPNNIAPGGLTGLATMIHYVTGDHIPIGTAMLALNIPIFIWALVAIGFKFLAKTIAATIALSVAIDLTAGIIPAYQGDFLIVTVFGGALAGLGLSLIFIRGATTGGTDLIANLIGKYIPHLSMGRLLMIVDMAVVVLSAFVYQGFESPLYAAIVIFITSKVIDTVLYGTNAGTGKMMFIISPQNDEIARQIMEQVDRGVTELKSKGCYTGTEGGVLLCAVKRQEVHRTRDIIYSVDPSAFLIVGEAGEITGEGFRDAAYLQARRVADKEAKRRARREKRARKKSKQG